jgi:pimeloyl-ACP methyl ester carboxylesterase
VIVFGFIERRLLFHPTPFARHWEEAPPGLAAEDVWLALDRRVKVHAWWCPPPSWIPARGAVLYCHGNAGNLSHRAESVRRWRDRLETAVLIFDYPGYGRSTGKPSEASCYAAADAASDWLQREKGVAPADVLLHGGSLGGAVAVELATRRPYRALVVLSTFTSVPDMASALYPWLPIRRFIRNRFDSLAKIGRTAGRVFLAHGTDDRVIPFNMGERLFAAAPAPKHFFPLAGYDHNHTPGPEYYTAIASFLQEVEHNHELVRQGQDPSTLRQRP